MGIYQVQQEAMFLQISKQVSVSFVLSGSHQLSVELWCTGLKELHAPDAPAA